MAAVNTTTFAALLKTLYSKKQIFNTVYEASGSPFFAMVPKDTSFGGANKVVPVIYGDNVRRSAAFATALAASGHSLHKPFTLTRVKDYALASIDTETVLATKGDAGAFVSAVKREMDSALNALGRSVAISLYGDGSGAIGALASDPSTGTTLTLAKISDITNFEVGMSIVFADDAASALRSGGARTISAINRDTGVITISAAADAALDAGDLIFAEGDYASASDRNKTSGLAAWIPDSAPGATAFFGVDRTADVSRLGGHRINASSYGTLQEAIFAACVRIGREGGRPDHCFLSYEKYEQVVNSVGSKREYCSSDVAGVGFKGIEIIGPTGPVKLYPDLNCPETRAYVLQLNTWTLHSMGDCPQILDQDGQKWLREATADAIQVRLGTFHQLGCGAPGFNAVVHTA